MLTLCWNDGAVLQSVSYVFGFFGVFCLKCQKCILNLLEPDHSLSEICEMTTNSPAICGGLWGFGDGTTGIITMESQRESYFVVDTRIPFFGTQNIANMLTMWI